MGAKERQDSSDNDVKRKVAGMLNMNRSESIKSLGRSVNPRRTRNSGSNFRDPKMLQWRVDVFFP